MVQHILVHFFDWYFSSYFVHFIFFILRFQRFWDWWKIFLYFLIPIATHSKVWLWYFIDLYVAQSLTFPVELTNQMEVLMFYQQNVAQNIHQTRVHSQLIRVLEKGSPISSKFRLQTLQIFRLILLLFDTDNFGVTPTSKQSWQHIPDMSFYSE